MIIRGDQIKCFHLQVFVQTPTANYTVQDYHRLYSDINFEDGWMMQQDTESLVADFTPPGVPVHCLYGVGISTPEAFQYSEKFPDVEPTVLTGEGDGTVNLYSALQCKRWIGKQKQPVTLVELPQNEHVDMLLNVTTVDYIKKVVFSPWCWLAGRLLCLPYTDTRSKTGTDVSPVWTMIAKYSPFMPQCSRKVSRFFRTNAGWYFFFFFFDFYSCYSKVYMQRV